MNKLAPIAAAACLMTAGLAHAAQVSSNHAETQTNGTANTPGPGTIAMAPTMTQLLIVPASGGAPRPNPDIHYEKEPLSVTVTGNVDNNANPANKCGYRVTAENLDTHNKASKTFTTFGANELFSPQQDTRYRISVEGADVNGVSACKGQVAAKEVRIHNTNGWITGMTVSGSAFYDYWDHFARVYIVLDKLTIQNGKPCTFEIVREVNGAKKTTTKTYTGAPINPINDYQGDEATFHDSHVTVTGKMSTPNLVNHATFTVKGIGPNACNGGAITKTVTVLVPSWNPVHESARVSQ